jgi:hypothetical protein
VSMVGLAANLEISLKTNCGGSPPAYLLSMCHVYMYVCLRERKKDKRWEGTKMMKRGGVRNDEIVEKEVNLSMH